MKNKYLLLLAFVLLALVQLYVPASMIWSKEQVLKTGVQYKFKTAPVDPNDPFRGKYITLDYEIDPVKVENENDWTRGQEVYLQLNTNSEGYAEVGAVFKEEPKGDADFIKTTIAYTSSNGRNKLFLELPFKRFYMDEFKAPEAEVIYREANSSTKQATYALIRVKNGEVIIEDVMIDERPIGEVVKANSRNE